MSLEVDAGAHLALPPPEAEGYDEVCPGLGRAWRLETGCGLLIVLIQALNERPDGTIEVLQTILYPFDDHRRLSA